MKKVSVPEILAWAPLRLVRVPTAELLALAVGEAMDALQILSFEELNPQARILLVLGEEFLEDEEIFRSFPLFCAREALALVGEQVDIDPRVSASILCAGGSKVSEVEFGAILADAWAAYAESVVSHGSNSAVAGAYLCAKHALSSSRRKNGFSARCSVMQALNAFTAAGNVQAQAYFVEQLRLLIGGESFGSRHAAWNDAGFPATGKVRSGALVEALQMLFAAKEAEGGEIKHLPEQLLVELSNAQGEAQSIILKDLGHLEFVALPYLDYRELSLHLRLGCGWSEDDILLELYDYVSGRKTFFTLAGAYLDASSRQRNALRKRRIEIIGR